MEKTETKYWNNRFSYLLSIIGFVIGLGNFWLFPTRCFENGGAVYLIPYTFFILVMGIPIVYLELLLGQVFRKANLGVFEELCPWLKGAAYTVIILNFLRQIYYNTVIAWALNLLFASFTKTLPWESDIQVLNMPSNAKKVYFIDIVLGKSNSTGIDNLGSLHNALLPCLIIVFVTVYAIIYDGATSIGNTVYVTAILPYILLIILLIKSVTLPGAGKGMKELFKADFSKLKYLRTWREAAIQICYSLGPGAGVLVAYASYSDNEDMNIKFYAIVVVICNALTSILCGIVLFCGLGYFSEVTSLEISDFLQYRSTIIFVIYPMIISKFAYGFLFSIAFFCMIFMIGLNSVYAEIEGMYAALSDRFQSLRANQARKKLVLLIICFFVSLPTITKGGEYVVTFLLTYGIAPAVLLILTAETIAATWIYGYDNLLEKVHEYSSANKPGIIMKWCWKVVVPILSVCLYITNFTQSGENSNSTQYGSVEITKKVKMGGEILSGLTLLPIPLYAAFWFMRNICHNKIRTNKEKVEQSQLNEL